MKQPTYIIDITMLVDFDLSSIAASDFVVHPQNVKKQYLVSDDDLAEYSAMIEMIFNRISRMGFEILDHKQSKKSYSYYIDFLPKDKYGNYWDEAVRIRFRISNHSNGADKFKAVFDPEDGTAQQDLLVKPFVLGKKHYPTPYSLVKGVEKVLNNLQNGDYSDF